MPITTPFTPAMPTVPPPPPLMREVFDTLPAPAAQPAERTLIHWDALTERERDKYRNELSRWEAEFAAERAPLLAANADYLEGEKRYYSLINIRSKIPADSVEAWQQEVDAITEKLSIIIDAANNEIYRRRLNEKYNKN